MASRLVVASVSCVAALLPSACTDRAAGLLEGVPERERNERLLAAINEAGYRCDSIVSATAPRSGGGNAWRVLCNDMLVYVVVLDPAEGFHIEPIAYGDPAVGAPSTNAGPRAPTGPRRGNRVN